MFYQFIIFVLLTSAGFLICRQLLKIPKLSMKKNIKILQAEKEKSSQQLVNRIIMPLAKPFARFIPIDPVKEARMASTLKRGGLELTPKEYYARAILCALFTLPLALLLFSIGAANLAPIVLIFAVVVYFHFMTDLKDKMKEKKKRIEIELPGFIRSILYKLDDIKDDSKRAVVQVDLIQIFEDYLKVASDVFHYDISVLVMEMKAKDIETALRNFNERIGMTEVSFLVNALIGLYRGEHQEEALAYLARDMDIKAREALRKKLNKLPRRVKIASIPLVAVTLACLLYVIGSHMIRSMGGLFNVKKGITLFKIQFQEVLPVRNTTTANSITQERRANTVRKRIANAISNARNVLANKSGDQMTGWLIVVLVVVVVGAVFMTLYQGSITTIWNSIVDKITGLLS